MILKGGKRGEKQTNDVEITEFWMTSERSDNVLASIRHELIACLKQEIMKRVI